MELETSLLHNQIITKVVFNIKWIFMINEQNISHGIMNLENIKYNNILRLSAFKNNTFSMLNSLDYITIIFR